MELNEGFLAIAAIAENGALSPTRPSRRAGAGRACTPQGPAAKGGQGTRPSNNPVDIRAASIRLASLVAQLVADGLRSGDLPEGRRGEGHALSRATRFASISPRMAFPCPSAAVGAAFGRIAPPGSCLRGV